MKKIDIVFLIGFFLLLIITFFFRNDLSDNSKFYLMVLKFVIVGLYVTRLFLKKYLNE